MTSELDRVFARPFDTAFRWTSLPVVAEDGEGQPLSPAAVVVLGLRSRCRFRLMATNRLACVVDEGINVVQVERLADDAIGAPLERSLRDLWRGVRSHQHYRTSRRVSPNLFEQP